MSATNFLDLASIDYQFEFDSFLRLRLLNHEPGSNFKNLILPFLEPIFNIIALKLTPHIFSNDLQSFLSNNQSKLIQVHRGLVTNLSKQSKKKDYLMNSLIFVSVIFAFCLIIKHFQAKVSPRLIFEASHQIFLLVYGLKVSESFTKKHLNILCQPDFLKRLQFLRKPSLQPQHFENSQQYESNLDLYIQKNPFKQEYINENPVLARFKADLKSYFKKKPTLKRNKEREPEKSVEKKDNIGSFSPRLKCVTWNSPGFRIFSRTPDQKRNDLQESTNQRKDVFGNEVAFIPASRDLRFLRRNSSKTFREKPKKRSPEEMLQELTQLKETLTHIHLDLKATYFKHQEIKTSKTLEEKKQGFPIEDSASSTPIPMETIKFPTLNISEKSHSKINKVAETSEKSKENNFLDEMKQIIVDKDKDEFIRFRRNVAREFINRFHRLLTEGSKSPDDRIRILQKKIFEKRNNLRSFLKTSELMLKKQ